MKLKNNTIILGFTVLLALGGVALMRFGNSEIQEVSGASHTGSSSLSFAERSVSYDFGSVSMANGNVRHDFELTNYIGGEVVVKKVMTSCMCTTADLLLPNGEKLGPFGMPGHGFIPTLDVTIQEGEKLLVPVTFDPAAHGPSGVGLVERQVFVDLEGGERITLSFKATVTP
ncbi:DUF1573 domain-containing protein [Candidatus Parcubacteria bacterium]|nr:MAG: DUF1573 domain-containing protein [Candidatus Parcubacteria bacterium]